MPTLQDFETASRAANPKDQILVRPGNHIATCGWLQSYASGGGSVENQTTTTAFMAALEDTYGKAATDAATSSARLLERLAQGKPLRAGQVLEIIGQAQAHRLELDNHAIRQADAEFRQGYAELEGQARAWTPQTRPSEIEHQGMRCNYTDQQDMRALAWNTRNHYNPAKPYDLNHDPRTAPVGQGDFDMTLMEIDDMVRLEMAAVEQQQPGLAPRLQNIQARLNLVAAMADQASGQTQEDARNIFTGPDMLFSNMTHTGGQEISGGALTEAEMQIVCGELAKISGQNPELLMMPGSVLWSKPSTQTPKVAGLLRPSDMVFTSTPVLAGGNLVHVTHKHTDGGDSAMAALSLTANHGQTTPIPTEANGFRERSQWMPSSNPDSQINSPDLAILSAEMMEHRRPGSPQRAWEHALARPGKELSTQNHFFQHQDSTYALEICRDHAAGCAQAEVKAMLQPGQEPRNNRIVDTHVILAAGGGWSATKSVAKNQGEMICQDSTKGMTESLILDTSVNPMVANHMGIKVGGAPFTPVQGRAATVFLNPQDNAAGPEIVFEGDRLQTQGEQQRVNMATPRQRVGDDTAIQEPRQTTGRNRSHSL